LLKAATVSFWMAHLQGCDNAGYWLKTALPKHLSAADQLHRR
jgi:hypothetical protein